MTFVSHKINYIAIVQIPTLFLNHALGIRGWYSQCSTKCFKVFNNCLGDQLWSIRHCKTVCIDVPLHKFPLLSSSALMFLGKVHLKFSRRVPGCDWPGWHAARINYGFHWLNGFKCSCQSCQSCWNIRSSRGLDVSYMHLCKGKGLLFEGRKGTSGCLTTNTQQGGSESGTQQRRRSGLLELLLFREKGSDTAYWLLYRYVCVICIPIHIYMYSCKHACTSGFGITCAFTEQAS